MSTHKANPPGWKFFLIFSYFIVIHYITKVRHYKISVNCRSSNEAKRRAWPLSKYVQYNQHDTALMALDFFIQCFCIKAKILVVGYGARKAPYDR